MISIEQHECQKNGRQLKSTGDEALFWQSGKTLDNNDLNQVVAPCCFSENKGLGGVFSLADS